MLLFSYHAARSLSDLRLRGRLALSDEDAAELTKVATQFAPVAAAFEPYLEMHPLRDRELMFMVGHMTGAEVEFPDPALLAALEQFTPTYRKHFRARHEASTEEFAAIAKAQLSAHGPEMARAVAFELGGQWRDDLFWRIRRRRQPFYRGRSAHSRDAPQCEYALYAGK
nr:hypothetical protein [uncultured Maritalea sp.]